MSDDSNKRQHSRIPVSLQVSYLSKGDLQKDLVTNLSPGGLFVRTSKPLEIGTEIDLEVLIAHEETPIHVRGNENNRREAGPACQIPQLIESAAIT